MMLSVTIGYVQVMFMSVTCCFNKFLITKGYMEGNGHTLHHTMWVYLPHNSSDGKFHIYFHIHSHLRLADDPLKGTERTTASIPFHPCDINIWVCAYRWISIWQISRSHNIQRTFVLSATGQFLGVYIVRGISTTQLGRGEKKKKKAHELSSAFQNNNCVFYYTVQSLSCWALFYLNTVLHTHKYSKSETLPRKLYQQCAEHSLMYRNTKWALTNSHRNK